MDDVPEPVLKARVVFGLVVMLIGAMLLADRIGIWGFRVNVPVWPWILILLGMARLNDRQVDARGRFRANRTGVWFVILGLWGLVNEYRLFGLHPSHSWPLLLVAAGGMIVWRAVDPVASAGCRGGRSVES